MPSDTVLMQNDHKHWLAEIERWEGYVRAWSSEQSELLGEFEALLRSFRHYGEELQAHHVALQNHRSEIVACERSMLEGHGQGVSEPGERHHRAEGHHAELRRIHERLKQTHHALAAALAILKHQPCRE